MPDKTAAILVGSNLARLVEISAKLDPRYYAHVIAQSHSPLEYLMGSFRTRPEIAIVELMGAESVVEFQDALQQNPATSFLFLVADMPPSAALAKVVGHRGVFLDQGESALVISATAVSLLHQHRQSARQA
jgi:hypothetical protein